MLLDTDNTGTDTLIDTFNTAVIETASEVLSKKWITKKPWVMPNLKLCDERRDLKKTKCEREEGAHKYRQADKQVKMRMLKAKEDWISDQCNDVRTKPESKQYQKGILSSERTNRQHAGEA